MIKRNKVLNYDYRLWKSLKHGVLEMDLVKDMNMELNYGGNDYGNDIEN